MKDKDTYIKVNRKYFDSPFWILTGNKQRTKAEAYIDLFNMATVDKFLYHTPDLLTTIELKRGEGVWSLRYLAKRWNWGKHKVETFINCLKTRQKVRQYMGQGIMITFLVDYDDSQSKSLYKYQPKGDTKGDGVGTGSGQGGDKYNNDKNEKNDIKETEPLQALPVKPLPLKAKFIKPSINEVKSYNLERKNGIDAEAFLDFYDANGWVQGKNKPIKDWKACVRTWENQRKEKKAKEQDDDRPKNIDY